MEYQRTYNIFWWTILNHLIQRSETLITLFASLQASKPISFESTMTREKICPERKRIVNHLCHQAKTIKKKKCYPNCFGSLKIESHLTRRSAAVWKPTMDWKVNEALVLISPLINLVDKIAYWVRLEELKFCFAENFCVYQLTTNLSRILKKTAWEFLRSLCWLSRVGLRLQLAFTPIAS